MSQNNSFKDAWWFSTANPLTKEQIDGIKDGTLIPKKSDFRRCNHCGAYCPLDETECYNCNSQLVGQ